MREPDGFREFVQARSPALLRAAWLLTGNPDTAQDLVQTALARTWPQWHRLTDKANGEAYVRRVLVTTYATWWRRRWRDEISTAEPPERTSQEDEFAAADLRDEVAAALATLPRRQRAVIVLRFYEDLSTTQTAYALGCSIGTVKSQTAKALTKLREHNWTDTVNREEAAR
ncbi:MAG TPA: SigE family RNA polymerase sigma factor [Mycobacteriales bacterium]|nr:SigE family RNA polymerase sigma factor [Mycobacteriales bacterium]